MIQKLEAIYKWKGNCLVFLLGKNNYHEVKEGTASQEKQTPHRMDGGHTLQNKTGKCELYNGETVTKTAYGFTENEI